MARGGEPRIWLLPLLSCVVLLSLLSNWYPVRKISLQEDQIVWDKAQEPYVPEASEQQSAMENLMGAKKDATAAEAVPVRKIDHGEDWFPYGFHRAESHITQEDQDRAMSTLINAFSGGNILPASVASPPAALAASNTVNGVNQMGENVKILGVIRGANTNHPKFDANPAAQEENDDKAAGVAAGGGGISDFAADQDRPSAGQPPFEGRHLEDFSEHAAEERAPLYYKAAYGNNVVPLDRASAGDHYSHVWPRLPGTPRLERKDWVEQANFDRAAQGALVGTSSQPQRRLDPWFTLGMRSRMTMLADHFSPDAPDGDTPSRMLPDFAFSDMKRECEAVSKKHSWDPVKHECLLEGKPIPRANAPAGEVDQYGWHAPAKNKERDSSLDYLTTDLRKDCEDMTRQDKGYAWDLERARCTYWGKPIAREAPPEAHRPLEYMYTHLKHDCEQRGPMYKWVEAEIDGEVGSCYKGTEKLDRPPAEEQKLWEPLDYLHQDLRNACAERNWVWEEAPDGARRCTQWGAGSVDQTGWKDEKLVMSTDKESSTPETVQGDRVLGFTFADLEASCAKMNGTMHYTEVPHRATCVSESGCGVVDQHGSLWDCERAGMHNVLGQVDLEQQPMLTRDKFNPDGAQEVAEMQTPPLQIDAAVWKDQTGEPKPMGYQNADLHGKDLDRFVKQVDGPSWTTGLNHANGESARYYYNHETGELVWQQSDKELASDGHPVAQDPPGEADQYGYRPEGTLQGITEESDTTGVRDRVARAGRVWRKGVDLRSAEVYWENVGTGERTWRHPWKMRTKKPQVELPSRRGTWSGTRGGNTYWTPALVQAQMGAGVRVFNPFVKASANCGGSTGECSGYRNGAGPAGEHDAFNPDSSDEDAEVRGSRGEWWDAENEKNGKPKIRAIRGAQRAQQWLHDSLAQGGDTVEGAGENEHGRGLAGRTEELASIYGVQISDSDANKYFGKDYSADYKAPSARSTRKYVRYLVKHLNEFNATATAPAKASSKGSANKWPERPKFWTPEEERKNPPQPLREQWCEWSAGGQMVRCRAGQGGASTIHAVSRLPVWQDGEENKVTMVGSGVWSVGPHIPGSSDP